MVNIDERLKRLKKKGSDLAKACEGINDTIGKIESQLREAGIGLKAEIELSDESEGDDEEGRAQSKITFLSYERHGQSVGLWVQERVVRYEKNPYDPTGGYYAPAVVETWAPRRLSDCSLELRILALEKIDALFDELEKVIDRSVKTLVEAKKNTEE